MQADWLQLQKFSDHRGILGVIDETVFSRLNFTPRRIFYISGTDPKHARGAHAHIKCTQIIVCVSGKMSVEIKTPVSTRNFDLDAENSCIIMPPMHWGYQYNFGLDTAYVVLANRPYIESEYIRDYDAYCNRWSE